MKKILPLLLLSQSLLYLNACDNLPEINCLPETRKLTDIVSTDGIAAKPEDADTIKKITIADKLIELQARCENDKLVDSSGKEIRFYNLTGCWGAAPPNYEQILAQQNSEIKALQEQYTLITMTCNPDGIPYP